MRRRKLKPGTLLGPLPLGMVTCLGQDGRPNIITAAWLGIINSEPPMLSVSIRKQRYSHPWIKASREFVVNLVDEPLAKAADYCGVKSGADTNKFGDLGLTAAPSSMVKAPTIAESPLSLECRIKRILELGSHDMFIAEIVAVTAREELFDKKDRLCLADAGLAAYLHGNYYPLGEPLGFMGYSVAAPHVYRRRMHVLKSRARKGKEAAPAVRAKLGTGQKKPKSRPPDRKQQKNGMG
ncbi:MAG TPA: flavin reductase family protein [Clostridiales bacterium]|nr:flavin reductase family protein [Clostridiales bacterium]